jgi:hypothetical protein
MWHDATKDLPPAVKRFDGVEHSAPVLARAPGGMYVAFYQFVPGDFSSGNSFAPSGWYLSGGGGMRVSGVTQWRDLPPLKSEQA